MRLFSVKALVAVAAFAGFSLCAQASTVTIGNGPTPTGYNDTCTGCYYILDQQFGVSGYHVTSYTFTAGEVGDITPVLFESTGGGLKEVGYGTTTVITTPGLGPFTETYTSAGGVNLTDANTYFGFYQYVPTVEMCGYVTTCTTPGNVAGIDYINGNAGPAANLGVTTPATGSLPTREYAISATATSPTPEPSSLILLGTGLAGLAGAVKRRFRS